jgi:hypothetical protein
MSLGAGEDPAPKVLTYNAASKTLIPKGTMPKQEHPDSDFHKGAVEEETSAPSTSGDPNLQGQLGHRDQDEMLKDSDSDFPEPGSNEEHSGEDR